MPSLSEQLDMLVEQADPVRVARLRPAPMTLSQAERLFGAIVASSPAAKGTSPSTAKRGKSASKKASAKKSAPKRASGKKSIPKKGAPDTGDLDTGAPDTNASGKDAPKKRSGKKRGSKTRKLPPLDEPTQAEIVIEALDDDAIEMIHSPVPAASPPPLPGSTASTPGPSKAAFDAVLDLTLSGDEALGPMESIEAEIEVDFVDGLEDGLDVTQMIPILAGASTDPLDQDPDDFDVDIDADAFDELDQRGARRPGFYPEDDEPTQAVNVDELDIGPPPDESINVRSSIKKLFRKK